MAQIIPPPSARNSRVTPGERRFAERLRAKLEDDYICWYDVAVGPKSLRPDFIILHPGRGILVLEVKDWKIGSLTNFNKTHFTIDTLDGRKSVANPFEQARNYAMAISNLLVKDKLLQEQDYPHRGKLVCPWGCGVVFTNITRKDFERNGLGEVINPDSVICSDEMTEGEDAEKFQSRLWGMQNYKFPKSLTLPQIDRIRWHLFPEIRIGGRKGPEDDAQNPSSIAPDVIKLMDLEQEKLSRNLGDGHRVIHGVAGSGKTLILVFRCLYLAQYNHAKPILLLCFNKSLAAKLKEMISEKFAGDNVHVRHFHGWCKDMCDLYHLNLPDNDHKAFDKQVEAVMAGVDSGLVPRAQYSALLIDEGHDFEPEWFKLLVQMIDPESNSLLLMYDDAQNIYRKRGRFSWKSVDVDAAGRTTILKVNYRNTVEILDYAYSFVETYLDKDRGANDFPLISPSNGGSHGLPPELHRCPNIKSETEYIAEWLGARNKEGVEFKSMALLCRYKYQVDKFTEVLKTMQLPVSSQFEDNSAEENPGRQDSIKVLTMHSCKGLEFNCVVIPDLGGMPNKNVDVSEEAKLLYVAMTRSTERLLLTNHTQSLFSEQLLGPIATIVKTAN